MPWDGLVFRDDDGNRSLTLWIPDEVAPRIAEMLRLSTFCRNQERESPLTETRDLILEAIQVFKWYIELKTAGREVYRYKNDEPVNSLNLIFAARRDQLDSTPPQGEQVTLHFSEVGWGRLTALQLKASCATKGHLIENSLQLYEFGVHEARDGFEIASPSTPGKREVMFGAD